jgi:serine/threonine-protein kinase PknK
MRGMSGPPSELAEQERSFELVRRLGAGATSVVWLAVDIRSGERVALKIARSAQHAALLADEAARLLLVDSPALSRLVDVGLIAARLRVPAGVRVDDCVVPGAPYVALQWAEGEPADTLGRLSRAAREMLALSVTRDVAEALHDLHRAGSAHGDVKPGNVVVARAGRGSAASIQARLVDLGLSDAADAPTPRGGTPRYLPPELLEAGTGSDGRARDLWALGLTVAELASPKVASAADPARAARHVRLSAPLQDLVGALLAHAPQARPSARWIRQRASLALGKPESAEARQQRRVREVRRTYLAVRRRELLLAAAHRDAQVLVDGLPGTWLAEAIATARKVAQLRGQPLDREAAPLRNLDSLGLSRWLVQLIGPAAARWPSSARSDAELAERLLKLAHQGELESLTLADLERGSTPAAAPPRTPLEIALALGAGCTDRALLDVAEQQVLSGAPAALGLALGRMLRLTGELGRALAVLCRVATPAAIAEAAETARRARDPERAARLLAQVGAGANEQTLAQVAATRARIALDSGATDSALTVLDQAPDTAGTLEVRALAQLARGERSAAQQSAARGRALARSEEERARSEAIAGVLAHAAGEPEAARQAFRQAIEHAVRAGAVLEEATYLTGASAAAADLGALHEALAASKRAVLLFEHLNRPREAARAALSRAAVYAQSGATRETLDAAADAITRARAAGDSHCRAFAHLAIADALGESDPEAIEHARRAATLLEDADPADQLRAAARVLLRGGEVDITGQDAVASDPAVPLPARLEWWGARAWVAVHRSQSAHADPVLLQLKALAAYTAPVAVRGPALSAGAELASALGDGETARHLAQRSAEAARDLLARTPPELRGKLASQPWVATIQSPRETPLGPEQLANIDTLVRALGRRDSLRPLLDQVLDALVLWTGVERGLLLLRAPGGKLVPRAARNLARADLVGPQLRLSHSLAERALQQRQPVVAVDAIGELPEVHASVHALKLRSVLAVPLVARGEALGVVYLDDRIRRGAFGPRELAWVRLVATVAAVAIADARDQLLLRRSARRAERAEARLARELARREAQLDVAERELARTRSSRATRFAYDQIVGESEAVRAMLRIVDRVTTADVPILLVGESGSGKELVARAIHDNGPRRNNPFVTRGAVRNRRRRDAIPGRNRRDEPRYADQAAAGARGWRSATRGLGPGSTGTGQSDWSDSPGVGGAGQGRQFPRRSLLSSQCDHLASTAVARAGGRRRAARSAFRFEARAGAGGEGVPAGVAGAQQLRLARQYPTARERNTTGSGAGR